MPPSSIHMDHVRAKTQHIQAASMDNAKAADRPAENSEGMSFWDVLDVVNPLQHIPVVNKIYQAVTGDTIRTPAKVAGAALFFGPVGLAVASADAILEKETGKDAMDHVASALGLEKDAAPAEDDPFTVTAPRPAQTADATPALQAAAPTASVATAAPTPGGPVELSSGQAALLESLMGGGQSLPSAPGTTAALAATAPATVAAPASLPMAALTTKAPATVPTSISAHAPAAGGIATAQQLKDLESTPGASAALTAARGMGTAAVVASLPAPGAAGSGDNLLTAMSQEQAAPARAGKGLAEYRAAAISAGSMGVKPIVASRANQMARNVGGNMPGAAVPAMPKQTTQPQAPTVTNAQPVATQQPQAAPAPINSPAQVQSQQPASWPPGGAAPLPKELIADMMSRAMDKYDSRPRTGGTNTDTVH